MNTHDTEVESKEAAQALIEAMDGFAVGVALDVIAKLELSRIQSSLYMPPEIERYSVKLKNLPQGSALNACRLASHMIRERTMVNAGAVPMQQLFTVWQSDIEMARAWKPH